MTFEEAMTHTIRYRLSRLIEDEVARYLSRESAFQPYFHVEHEDDKVTIDFQFPAVAELPSHRIVLTTTPPPKRVTTDERTAT